MMTRVYFVRHAQPEHAHEDDRTRPLTAEGIADSKIVLETLKDKGIELISEGDTWPRPRFVTSAARLECFDMALRADGNIDGILKYMECYVSSAAYETGFVDAHIAHEGLYQQIEQHFSGKIHNHA